MGGTHLIIGAGKMGGSLLSAWISTGLIKAQDLTILDPAPQAYALEAIAAGAQHIKQAANIPETIDTVVLGIKPQMMSELGADLARHIPQKSLIISILAGTSLKALSEFFAPRPIVRAMPNTPALIGAAISAISASPQQDPSYLDRADALLSASGQVRRVESEALLDAVTAISGSGPAYIFHLCEALQHCARDLGLSQEDAPEFARQTIIGAAKLLDHSPLSPAQLRENVTSPNGTTQAALEVLMHEPNGLTALMHAATRAAYERAKALGQS